jgi:hypothetical protein
VSTYPDHILRMGSQHLAELKRKAAEFERQLWDAHESLEHQIAYPTFGPTDAIDAQQQTFHWTSNDDRPDDYQSDGYQSDGYRSDDYHPDDYQRDGADDALPAGPVPMHPLADPARSGTEPAGPAYSAEDRTTGLVNHGRHGAKRRHRLQGILAAAIGAAVLAALITMLVLKLSAAKPSWPASVTRVQREIAVACQNPDVASEPGQVNFACARDTRQILWVFSLLTSGNNPDYASIKTGRQGLEPITPAQGGEVAWSLNLHHPYNPADPIDSLEVAARAINNIIGGATLTAASGKPVVQPGLESISANCARYTGSGALTSRHGYPDRCAKPVKGAAGLQYLVADVFQKWVVGASPSAAQDAAILFQNAKNPGDPRVRAILRSLQSSKMPG